MFAPKLLNMTLQCLTGTGPIGQLFRVYKLCFIENTHFYKPNFIKSQDLLIVHNEFS